MDKNHEIVKFIDLYVPFLILIDKEQIIRFLGYPWEVNLEDKINQCLDEPLNQS